MMRIVNRTTILLGACLLAGISTGCGKSVSDAQMKDVAKLAHALQPDAQGFQSELFASSLVNSTCAPIDSNLSDSCQKSCTEKTISISCSLASSKTFSCGPTTYTVSGGSFSTNVDFTNLDVVNGTGTMVFTMDMALTASGGEFQNSRVECRFGLVIDLAAIASAAQSGQEPDFGANSCENFSCSLDGTRIDCDDLLKYQADAQTECAA